VTGLAECPEAKAGPQFSGDKPAVVEIGDIRIDASSRGWGSLLSQPV
jgi:hypothetical protein